MPSDDTLEDLIKRRDTLIVALWNTMFQISGYYELEAWPEYDLDLWMKVVDHPAIQDRLEKRQTMPSNDVTDEELKYLDGVMDSTITATYTAWYFEAWERRIKPILRKLLKERDTQRTTIARLEEEYLICKEEHTGMCACQFKDGTPMTECLFHTKQRTTIAAQAEEIEKKNQLITKLMMDINEEPA